MRQAWMAVTMALWTAHSAVAAQAAQAADSCAFRPRSGGAIAGYQEPKPAEQADGEKLIAQLPPEFAADQGRAISVDSVVLAYEGRRVWSLRRAAARELPPLAQVRGPGIVAAKWHAEYSRVMGRMLLESLRSGRKFDVLAAGECN